MVEAIKSQAAHANLAVTENGAVGYQALSDGLVEFFFKVSSMRRYNPVAKMVAFLKAAAGDREMALRLLFYVRDVRQGVGERQLFRDIFNQLTDEEIRKLYKLLPEYGRWDDVVFVLTSPNVKPQTKQEVSLYLKQKLEMDAANALSGKPISLLAKWLPSPRRVSKAKVALAKELCETWGWTQEKYRKTLSSLRKILKVVEQSMTANEWGEIEYEKLPSKAAMLYREAFSRHDTSRYNDYLASLKNGTARVNARTLFPYEIVSQYSRHGLFEEDDLLEEQWKALPVPTGIFENAIVVRDGSGSMMAPLSGGRATALDVATSLAILMADNLKGEFHGKFITFSHCPKLVDLTGCKTLREKIRLARKEAECDNTNIQRTMSLILNTAVANKIPQSEIPMVVIISDLEFDVQADEVRRMVDLQPFQVKETLFKAIQRQWQSFGYQLPKLVFWNVMNRSGAMPIQPDEAFNGLRLVSGFSQNVLDILNGNETMSEAVRKKLMSPRYDAVSEALRK